jgi:hypothetical protein
MLVHHMVRKPQNHALGCMRPAGHEFDMHALDRATTAIG